MKKIASFCILGISIIINCGVGFACSPYWYDETAHDPIRLYHLYNGIIVSGGLDGSTLDECFQVWQDEINYVNDATLQYLITVSGEGQHTADFDASTCPGDYAGGCCYWDDLDENLLIRKFSLHFDSTER